MSLINESHGNPEKIIAIFIALLGLSVPFFMNSVAPSMLFDPARLLGENLVYLLIGISISYLITIRARPQYRAWVLLGMSILFLLFTLRQAYEYSQNINKGRKSATEIVTLMEDTNRQVYGSQSKIYEPPIIPLNENPSITKNGGLSDAEIFSLLMETLQPRVTKFAHDGLELNNKITNSGIENVLAPHNLTSASGIKTGRLATQNLRNLVDSRNDLLANYYKDITEKVYELNLPESTKKSFEKSFYKNKPMLEHNYSELSRITNSSLNNIDKILDLVEGLLGVITIDNGQLIFPDEISLNQYNGYLAEVIRLTNEEENISNLLAQKSTEHMKLVNDNLKKL